MPLTISSPVVQLLNKETFHAHTESEKVLAPKLASIKSYEDYASSHEIRHGN